MSCMAWLGDLCSALSLTPRTRTGRLCGIAIVINTAFLIFGIIEFVLP